MILRLVLGDQLNAGHSWWREQRDDVLYVMMEIRSETDYAHHHAQKVLALFACMRGFAAAIEAAGHRVRYFRIGDPDNAQNFAANLRQVAHCVGADRFERMEADEWRVEQALDAAAAECGLAQTVVGSEHFLVDRCELKTAFVQAVPRMEYFYRELRQRFSILLADGGEPEGGQWNYDVDNRARWPGSPAAPAWRWPAHDLSDLWREIVTAGVATMGDANEEHVRWPLTRREARAGLAQFVHEALPHFGRYQDALTSRSLTLFHSLLSFSLNVKMLHPLEVIHAALDAYRRGAVTLESTEGFVRQILGWREFVRGVYWARMPGYGRENALRAVRPLPGWYWSGETGMACLAHAIGQSLRHAYAHHIQRLMVTGNFALLAGCDPDEVDAWYLGIYVDAFEWVEMPNTRGMSQFADGGVVGSKPYCGAASYISKQGDYCKGCAYDPKLRHGERACPFNSLYWHFHDRHRALLSGNPRLKMPYQLWEKMGVEERQATLQQAELYLANLDAL